MVETQILESLGLKQRPRQNVWPSAADAEFLSDEEIKDAAVGFALRRVALAEALKHIDHAYDVKRSGVEAQYQPELTLTFEVLGRIRESIDTEAALLQENEQKSEQLRHNKNTLSGRIKELRFNVYVSIQEIRKKRLKREKELFETEDAKLKSEADANYDDVIRDLDKQVEIARKLYELEKERWDVNKEEYTRRAKELAGEKERVEEELRAARETIGGLKRFGITRHTAGFLIWAGYASLAGVGGVIANLLSGQPMGGTGYVSLIFQYLTNIVHALQTMRTFSEFLRLVLIPCIVVLVILAVTGGLIWVTDFVLRKFVKRRLANWGEPRVTRRSRRKRGDSREQAPGLTPEVNRLSIPLPDVDRRSYIKLLALLPYVFLAFVIALLSITGGAESAPAPANAFSMTYIGVVFALLTVSVMMLYATKVIEPRWLKLAETVGSQRPPAGQDGASKDAGPSAPQVGFRMYLRAHWEFLVVVGAMVLAILTVISLPTADYRSHIIWSAVAIFMCFSSLAFAYGIIQRGLFRNEEYLDGRRAMYARLIEKYSTAPTIGEVFETVNPEEVKEIIGNYRKSRQDLDELRLLYELKRHFADNYLDDGDLLKYWSKLKNWASPFGFLGSLSFKKYEPAEPGLLDYEAAPEETSAVNRFREEQLQVRSELDEIAADIATAEKSRSEIKSKLRELENEMRAQERRRVELEQSLEQDKARLRVKREADYLTFKSAYSLGVKVADFTEF